jgi:hypothetical protein
MLVCVAKLLQAQDFIEIEHRYPTIGNFFGEALPQAVARQTDEWKTSMSTISMNDVVHQACIDALFVALEIARNRNSEKFAQLASKVFGQCACPNEDFPGDAHNLFHEGELYDVYSWRTDSWCILKESELTKLEALLCQPRDGDPPHEFDRELNHLIMRNTKYYFSAAAVAVSFCKSPLLPLILSSSLPRP